MSSDLHSHTVMHTQNNLEVNFKRNLKVINKSAKTLFESLRFSDQFSFKQEIYEHLKHGEKARSRIKLVVSFLYRASVNNITHKRPTTYRPHKD